MDFAAAPERLPGVYHGRYRRDDCARVVGDTEFGALGVCGDDADDSRVGNRRAAPASMATDTADRSVAGTQTNTVRNNRYADLVTQAANPYWRRGTIVDVSSPLFMQVRNIAGWFPILPGEK